MRWTRPSKEPKVGYITHRSKRFNLLNMYIYNEEGWMVVTMFKDFNGLLKKNSSLYRYKIYYNFKAIINEIFAE